MKVLLFQIFFTVLFYVNYAAAAYLYLLFFFREYNDFLACVFITANKYYDVCIQAQKKKKYKIIDSRYNYNKLYKFVVLKKKPNNFFTSSIFRRSLIPYKYTRIEVFYVPVFWWGILIILWFFFIELIQIPPLTRML